MATAPRKTTARTTTTPKRTTTPRKPAAAKSTAKPAVAAKTPANPAGVTMAQPMPEVLRKKRLIDDAVARCGIKKKDAKPAIEAALAVIGAALDKGEELNLPPMGKVKIQRVMDKPNAKVMVARIRQPKPRTQAPRDPLAEAAE